MTHPVQWAAEREALGASLGSMVGAQEGADRGRKPLGRRQKPAWGFRSQGLPVIGSPLPCFVPSVPSPIHPNRRTISVLPVRAELRVTGTCVCRDGGVETDGETESVKSCKIRDTRRLVTPST